jgi:hypothetical protein
MRRFIISCVAMCVSGFAAAPAVAQDPGSDVRCLLVSNVFARIEADATRKQLAQASAVYFTGRAAARLSPAQIKAQIVAQSKSVDKTTGGPIMTACAKRFQQDQRMMQAIGQDLQKTKALAPPKK